MSGFNLTPSERRLFAVFRCLVFIAQVVAVFVLAVFVWRDVLGFSL